MTTAELIPWTMTSATRSTILAALGEATDAKRDAILNCGDCHGGGCETCAYRAEAAAEYERVAGIIGETYEPKAEAVPEPGPTWAEAVGQVVRNSPGYAALLAIQEGREAV